MLVYTWQYNNGGLSSQQLLEEEDIDIYPMLGKYIERMYMHTYIYTYIHTYN